MRWPLILLASASLPACDELPAPAPASSAAPTASASPSSSDNAIITPAEAFWKAAESYASTCYVLSSIGDHGVVDRCYAKGECASSIKANFDKNCGFTPDQPQAVIDSAKKLRAAAEGQDLTPKAQIFVRHAQLFGQFVERSHKPNSRCLEVADAFYRSECWSTTGGTLAKYQEAATIYNQWRPDDERALVPVDHVIMSGAARLPIWRLLATGDGYAEDHRESATKRLKTSGLNWQRCPDGPCIADRASAY